MGKFREWTIYGDYFQHPNGYPITKIKVLNFESGPLLEKDEKVKVIEHQAFTEAVEQVKRLEEKIEKMKEIITDEDLACADCVEAKAEGYTLCGDCSC
jgi:hypothetical protein